jgi:glutamate racemase
MSETPKDSPSDMPLTIPFADTPAVDERPIGVFDSGVGGLTVLHECLVSLPHEDFVYLGDTLNFPYGSRSGEEVRGLAFWNASFLVELGVKLIVVACNSATAVALPELQASLRTPVIGVIMPGARVAAQVTRNRRVGILGTEATVQSASYQQALQTLDAGCETVAVPCPRLAALIQEGDVFSEEVDGAVRSYVAPLKEAGVDTVILGCTHYPLITPMLRRLLGPAVSLVNSAEEIAREVAETLERKGITNRYGREGTYTFYATSDPEGFRSVGARFLQLPIKHVALRDDGTPALAACGQGTGGHGAAQRSARGH